ncbi:hypothetical protein GGR09_001424, partial [Bartonella heixiaziensis]
MKKNQPFPFSSPSVKDLIKRYEETHLGASRSESVYAKVNKPSRGQKPQKPVENLYTTVAPLKPLSMKDVSQSGATLQESETVYAEAPPKPPRMRNVSQSSATLQ